MADGDLVPPQVEVVDAHLTAFLPSQPGAVQQAGHEGIRPLAGGHGVEQAADLLGRQHGGQPFGPPGPQGIEPGQCDPQHLLIQEEQGVEGLVLRAGRDMAVGRQVGQEALDLRGSQGGGVAQAVKADVALGPVGIAVFGARRELADAASAAEAVEQPRRLGEGQVADVESKDVAVEEGEGGMGLFETGEGILFGSGDVFEEAADVAGQEVARVAFAVEEDEAARPGHEAFGGSLLSQAFQRDLANEIEEARGLGRRTGGQGWRGHGWTPERERDIRRE